MNPKTKTEHKAKMDKSKTKVNPIYRCRYR